MKKRAVLVGCGSITGAWLRSETLRKKVDLVGFVDLDRSAAETRARESGAPDAVTGTNLNQLLKRTEPEIVFDCTVPQAHCQVTITALRHGCHVLGEKPMAESMVNARKMVAAARKAGRIYAVIQNRRYQPEIRSLRKFLDSEKIGRITTVQSNFFIGAHFGGFRDRMKHVLLLDMAIHSFDQARLITGSDATSVYCHEWNPSGSWYDHGASAIAVFEMSNGIVYTYQGSWCSEGANTTWGCDWRIIGEKGTILWNGGSQFRAETITKPGGFMTTTKPLNVPVRHGKRFKSDHNGVIADFLKAVDTGQTPETICTDNIKSLSMVHSAVQSAEKKRTISIKQ